MSKRAAAGYQEALEAFLQHDAQYEWTPERCQAAAAQFVQVAARQKTDAGKTLPEALYNAGLAQQRCGNEAAAMQHFQAATQADAGFHRARAQMALFEYNKSGDLDRAITSLERIIRDAKFQNVEALVSVAALQMERNNSKADSDGASDFERAKKNIQRALAIDDGFMPAMNQLAVYYLESAKGKRSARSRRRSGLAVAGAQRVRANRQRLELAALVVSRGVQMGPSYAPIRNTAGLIQVELRNYNGAVKQFMQARRLDPSFFEAHMNYAAVSLSFRGFKEAEDAYRAALRLQPEDYEAHLGLALALRGQINDANYDTYLAEAKKHLDKCKSIDGKRPEAYYNEAILTQEYEAKGGDSGQAIPALRSAASKYTDFVKRAEGEPAFAEAVKRSKARAQEIRETIEFIEEGERLRKEQEEIERKAKEAEQQQAAAAAAG